MVNRGGKSRCPFILPNLKEKAFNISLSMMVALDFTHMLFILSKLLKGFFVYFLLIKNHLSTGNLVGVRHITRHKLHSSIQNENRAGFIYTILSGDTGIKELNGFRTGSYWGGVAVSVS